MEPQSIQPNTQSQFDPSIVKVLSALKTVEGGNYNDRTGDGGKSAGAYQWNNGNVKLTTNAIPSNFQSMAKANGLNPNDFSPANQNKVAYYQVQKWKNEGKQPDEIAALWNGAKKDPSTGKYTYNNPEYGVKFRKALTGQISKNTTQPTVADKRTDLEQQGQPVSVNPEKTTPTLAGNIIRGAIKPLARYGLTLGRAAEGIFGGGPQDLTQAVHSNYLGDITPTGQQGTLGQRVKDVLGNTAEVASNFIGGEGTGAVAEAGLKGAIKEGAVQGLKAGAIGGGLQGAGQSLTENKSVGQSLLQGGIGAVAGGATGGLLGGTLGAAGAGVRRLIGTPIADSQFAEKVNQAFPVLKKDVGNLDTKVKNVHTALSDIVNNKDSLGLTDKSGNPRLPKTFSETVDAQNIRLPQIYKDYTEKLSGVDAQKFDTGIKSSIKGQVDSIDSQLKKENSIDGRRALTKIKTELGSLRDTSPLGIQNYIQSINQKVKPLAPGGALTTEQIKYANLGGEMRKILDTSIDKIDGKGYQDLRSTYAAHKALQSQLLMAAKKEINATPGLTDKLANAGMTAEGINFLLTHDPHSLVVAGSLKLGSKLMKYINSPTTALQGLFSDIEKGYKIPRPSSPQIINAKASIEPKNISINRSINAIKNKSMNDIRIKK